MNIVWYGTAEEVNAAFWRPVAEAEGIALEELLASPQTGLDGDGNEVELALGADIEGMKLQGCWGFMDTETQTIHAWAAHDADPANVLHMLAHEIGHATGTPDPDDLLEELRADTYGKVARQAFELMQARFKPISRPTSRIQN